MIEARWLSDVLDALDRGDPIPAPADTWLRDGIRRHLAADVTLDRALGLRGGRGERTVRDWLARAERDRHLRRAWRLLPGSPTSHRTAALLHRIERYRVGGWPRDCQSGAPPDDPLRRALYDALSTGAPIPRTLRYLHDIVTPGAPVKLKPRMIFARHVAW